jgi:hypothetical protein
MDSARFDGLVRRFGQTRSRRQALRGLAGIAASGALALSGRAVSAQDCKGNGKACKKGSQCCGDLQCRPSLDGPKNPKAPTGSTAGSGKVCTQVGSCADVDDYVCGDLLVRQCGDGGSRNFCFCERSVEGDAVCLSNEDCAGTCTATSDCEPGRICADTCCGKECVLDCPNPF